MSKRSHDKSNESLMAQLEKVEEEKRAIIDKIKKKEKNKKSRKKIQYPDSEEDLEDTSISLDDSDNDDTVASTSALVPPQNIPQLEPPSLPVQSPSHSKVSAPREAQPTSHSMQLAPPSKQSTAHSKPSEPRQIQDPLNSMESAPRPKHSKSISKPPKPGQAEPMLSMQSASLPTQSKSHSKPPVSRQAEPIHPMQSAPLPAQFKSHSKPPEPRQIEPLHSVQSAPFPTLSKSHLKPTEPRQTEPSHPMQSAPLPAQSTSHSKPPESYHSKPIGDLNFQLFDEISPRTRDSCKEPTSELDLDVLNALGETSSYGPNIHDKLTEIWLPILINGLPEGTDNFNTEYAVPSNCKLLKAPTINPEFDGVININTKNRDERMRIRQDRLGQAITAMARVLSSLLQNENNLKRTEIIKMLSDSCKILTTVHFDDTETRRILLKKQFDPYIAAVFEGHNRDRTLFGNDLHERIEKMGIKNIATYYRWKSPYQRFTENSKRSREWAQASSNRSSTSRATSNNSLSGNRHFPFYE